MVAGALSTLPPAASSQRDRAYRAMRRLLILQQLPEGERLREPEWASKLGVNRMALREAFARLEAEGLIQRGPKTGYLVPRLSDEDIQEVLEVRSVLECAAIERLVRVGRHTPEHLQPLRDACDQLEMLIQGDLLLGVSEADRRFHEELVSLAGNRRLVLIYNRAPLPMIHGPIVQEDHWPEISRQTLTEHRHILSLITRGDVPGAQAALRQHLSDRYLQPVRG